MTSDPDIFRAAKLLIDQHGADAGLRAAERADHLLEAGDMIGTATWQRILAAIEELGRGRREGETVNCWAASAELGITQNCAKLDLMFESILFRCADEQGDMDPGLLAEALLFYQQTILAITSVNLASLIRTIGPDDLIGLIKDKHVSPTFLQDGLGMSTDKVVGLHSYIHFALKGDQTNRKMTREERMLKLVSRVIDDRFRAKRVAKELARLLPHREINAATTEPGGVIGVAFRDLSDESYIQAAADRIIGLCAPVYSKSQNIYFKTIRTNTSFLIDTNINFEAVTREMQQNSPPGTRGLSAITLCTELLDARADMLLSANYLSELVTTPLNHAVIDIKFSHLLQKGRRNTDQIRAFQEVALDGRSLREAINSGERSFSEFRRLLDKASRFKQWLGEASPDGRLIAEYQRAAIAGSWIETLRAKVLRFGICTLASAVGPAAGVAVGVVDTFLIDKLLHGWRPHHFVQGRLGEFVGAEE